MDSVNCLKATGPLRGVVYFLPPSSQKILVLIWSTLEGWKAESTLEPSSGYEQGTPGLEIQRLNHWAIAPLAIVVLI